MIQRFLPSRSHGGAGHFTHGLSNALARRGHAVTVFSQHPRPTGALYDVHHLKVPPAMEGSQPAEVLYFPWQIARQRFSAFDLIHAQGDDHLLLRRNTPPVVRTLHASSLTFAYHNGVRGRSPKRFFLFLYFYLLELVSTARADACVAVSQATGRHYFNVRHVVPNGIDLELYAATDEERSVHPSILFVGDMGSQKRGGFLLDVFRKEVRRCIPDAELWLVYRDSFPGSGQGEGIHWLGPVEPARLASWYRRAWVFCLPSSYEGFGRPYVEAMAAGTPVVATPNPGADEVLDHGRYGALVADDRLGQALIDLLQDAGLRRDYAERGRVRAQEYAWERVAEKYERIYETVLRRRVAQPVPA
jgi:glycosyltransferase involved in cell wall biosynthesis